MADLFSMEGEQGEDLDAFVARLRGIFLAQIESGDLELADIMIDVPAVSDLCPQSTLDASEAAELHAYTISIFQTMGPWLMQRIDEVCDDQASRLDQLIETNSASGATAAAEAEI